MHSTVVHAARALLPTGWATNVQVGIGHDGRIASVGPDVLHPGAPPGLDTGRTECTNRIDILSVEVLLPAPVNVHSHAFQRAMAGLTESRGPNPGDSFWTWRQLMYRFLQRLTPAHVEAIAAFVQMQMLEAGYGGSVEFHYLHHQSDGTPYANPAEMCERVIAAAAHSGMGLTLLPVHYQYGGCDRRPLGSGQCRFGTDVGAFARLWELAGQALHRLPKDACLGVAPHSLRAVAPESLPELVALAGQGPIHMHLAEQIGEVEEVRASLGARPVEWLLEAVPPDQHWCLIHCTRMLPHETAGLARTGAVAGLCPITESSLGDGIFDGVAWLANGGRIAIGSDSNIRIALSEELRTLEYSQRLRDHSRAALACSGLSTGRRLFEAVLQGGAQAAGRASGRIEVGGWADLVALDGHVVDLEAREGDAVLDSFIFAGDDRWVQEVWSAGRHRVQAGRHIERESITLAYRHAVRELRGAL